MTTSGDGVGQGNARIPMMATASEALIQVSQDLEERWSAMMADTFP